MPWCPKCKLEYVAGKTICPDCNSELVASLDGAAAFDIEDIPDDLTFGALMSSQGMEEDVDTEAEKAAALAHLKKAMEKPAYNSIEEAYIGNKSGAGVLIVCGLGGLVFLLLAYLGIFHLPLTGFSRVLMYTVMGCLFLVFLFSGILAAVKVKTLKPLLEEEKKQIEEAVEYIRAKKNAGDYKGNSWFTEEEAYLAACEQAVIDLEEHFPDAAPGFANFVCDRYLGEVFDED